MRSTVFKEENKSTLLTAKRWQFCLCVNVLSAQWGDVSAMRCSKDVSYLPHNPSVQLTWYNFNQN